MSTRFFKWETSYGTAYGKLPIDHVGTHFIGVTKTRAVSIAVDDPSLVEISEVEFFMVMTQVRANVPVETCSEIATHLIKVGGIPPKGVMAVNLS